MLSLRLPARGEVFSGTGVQVINAFAGWTVAVLLLTLFFYYASSLFWQVFYPEGFRSFVPAVDAAASRKAVQARGKWDWFVDTAVVRKKAPPPSRLKAVLIGVIAVSRESGKGMAFINYKGKDKIYRVGDEIAPAVVLHEIARTYVTLQRDDRFEKLEIKKSESVFGGDSKKSRADDDKPQDKQQEKQMEELPDLPQQDIASTGQFKELLRENPLQLLNLFDFGQVDVNGRTGFNLSPRRGDGKKLLESLGWQQDDVIMSVNGAPVFQVSSNPRLWQALLKADKIKLKVIRDGAEATLSM